MSQKFLICEHCKNIIEMVDDKGVLVMCCGQKMTELVPGAVDASVEKHVPEVTVEGSLVKVFVGSAEHPMTEEHLIDWISVCTDKGTQRKTLSAGSAPEAVFALSEGEKAVTVYAYCNLHGLWKKDL